MATAAAQSDLAGERRFFLKMALVIAGTAVAGFGFAAAIRPWWLAAPWWVHGHALVFAGWVAIYVMQNLHVDAGRIARHRALGWLALGWATLMVPVGIATTCMTIASHRTPPFFEPAFFLTLDPVTVVTFYGFILAAIALRGSPDWHRRLMLVATITLTNPPLGRLVPMPLTGGEMGLWVILLVQMLAYFLPAVVHDRRTLGRVHPALVWGIAITLIDAAILKPISILPPVAALAHQLTG